MLKKAKRGDIFWCGIAYVDSRNIAHSSWEPSCLEGNVAPLLTSALGAVRWLDARLIDSALGGGEPADED
ncbi:MAG: hypothetical protein ACXWCH_30915 [Burkholderiales bacterium]